MIWGLPVRIKPAVTLAAVLILLSGAPCHGADTGNGAVSLNALPVTDKPLPDTSVPAGALATLRLSEADTATYAKIFAARRRGDNARAEALAKNLQDRSLVDWARMKRTHARPIWLPVHKGNVPRTYTSPFARTKEGAEAAHDIGLSVDVLIKTDDTERARGVVRRALAAGTIDRIESAQMNARIAAAQLRAGQTTSALTLAHFALQVAGDKVPDAAWVAGLASWMDGDYEGAARYFAWVPKSPYAGPWMRSAASFWTARAMMRLGEYARVSAWMADAARHPRSFYGLIATRALGKRFDFNWVAPPFTQRHLATLRKHGGAVRALKLAQAGEADMARIELALLPEADAGEWREALGALAVAALKPDAAIKVAGLLEDPNGVSFDMALYPVAPWKPQDGYRLDPALLHAFARQESRFKPTATNKTSGATGLLQILPRTARSVDKKLAGRDSDALKNPAINLALGQKYLENLLERSDGDLFDAAIAYNAGPGNLAAWKDRFAKIDDPLLFIEMIPYAETRAYVERVMANYWIYSLRMGTGVATLDAVAAGSPAIYASYRRDVPPAGNDNVFAAVTSNAR